MFARLRLVVRLLSVVLGASAVAIVVLCVTRAVLPHETLRKSNSEVGNYIQAVGTIYAVLLAFVVYVVWGQYNDARTQVDREASELVDLYRSADGFPSPQQREIQRLLSQYVELVITEEWSAMARGDEAVFERVGDHLDLVWAQLHALGSGTEHHEAMHGELLSRYNELSDARTSRLTSARARIPLGLRLLLYVGAFVMVASMYLIAVDEFVIHAIMTGALAGAVFHVLYLISDLDDVFAGDWRVSPAAFERARRYIARHAASPAGA